MSCQLHTQFSLDDIIHSYKSLWTPKVVLDFQPVIQCEHVDGLFNTYYTMCNLPVSHEHETVLNFLIFPLNQTRTQHIICHAVCQPQLIWYFYSRDWNINTDTYWGSGTNLMRRNFEGSAPLNCVNKTWGLKISLSKEVVEVRTNDVCLLLACWENQTYYYWLPIDSTSQPADRL